MRINWEHIYQRHEELLQKLTNPEIGRTERRLLQKELAHLVQLIAKQKEVTNLEQTVADIKGQQIDTQEEELVQLFKEELVHLGARLILKQQELEDLIIPPDEHDERSVFLEIRAGTGGQEAALFAADLVKMYTNYALHKNWKVSIIDESLTDIGGIRDVTLHIQGSNVYGHLKHEAGVHRVQRVPKTETQGRIHTSTATVAVLPEAQEVDVTINPADVRIDVFRASGAGGQHVNTTDSAVRITHIPTGVVVTCQDERSQYSNKKKAMKVLQSRLLAHKKEKHEAEIGKKRKEMVGRGMRSEKVRTYNFPQNRITDHQVNLTLKKLDRVIEGDLDEIVAALQQKDRQDRKQRVFVEPS